MGADQGLIMRPHIEAIKAQSEAAKEHAKSYNQVESLELKLGAMCTIGPTILSDLIVNFHADFSGVTLAVAVGAFVRAASAHAWPAAAA